MESGKQDLEQVLTDLGNRAFRRQIQPVYVVDSSDSIIRIEEITQQRRDALFHDIGP
jgi:hypothetical protein